MYARKKRFGRFGSLILVALVLVGGLIGAAVGKYIKTTTYTGTLTVNAELAESMTLLESEAKRNNDGTYYLNTAKTVTENAYELIPGLDIPKDPHITITKKTPIEAYLYVEVVDNTPNGAIGYEMTGNWLLLEGVTGKHNGAVYVYTTDKSAPAVVDDNVGAEFKVHLLKDNQITVSQKLNTNQTNDTMTFYAAMGEVAASDLGVSTDAAKEVYNELI